MKSIKSANLKDKRVLLRVDFNVPITSGKITDDSRIRDAVPTIEYILEKGGSVIIISHLGRPGGKRLKALSLKPIAKRLEKILDKKVEFVNDSTGAKAREKTAKMKPGEIVCLENLRFSQDEELGDPEFAKKLANLGNLFVQEAFSNSHRSHASMLAITKFLPSYAGLHFEKEYLELSKIIDNPAKPFVFVAGGKKAETKMELLKKLIDKADIIVLGGGVANTFLFAEGYEIGNSFFEEEYVTDSETVIREAYDKGVEVLLPEDVVVAKNVSENAKGSEKGVEQIETGDIIVDIGPKTVSKYAQPLKFAGTIFWNGPMGIAEYKNFSRGTEGIASIITSSEAVTVVGGGDTISALKDKEMINRFSYVSTGGGAMMKFLTGEKLPAVEALK